MFAGLSSRDLHYLAGALADGRLRAPYTQASLDRLDLTLPDGGLSDLGTLTDQHFAPNQIARLAQVIADERAATERAERSVEIVVTGPETQGLVRDTAVVIEQLFAEARSRVLLVGYALHGGRAIFKTLAERMDANPELNAVCCFDISRKNNDTTRDSDLVDRFAHGFVTKEWPGRRLPEVFYDPRGLEKSPSKRAVLHAKTIVIDGSKAIITSANPTRAAYLRNIELGALFHDSNIPGLIERHFLSLIESAALRQVHLPSPAQWR